MDDYGFDLGGLDEGLDLSGMLPPAPVARPSVAAPNLQQPGGLKALLPILAALPAIIKGGQGGPLMAAQFLEGYQRAKQQGNALTQQNFQNQRLTQADERSAAQLASLDAYRSAQLRGQTDTRRQSALTSAINAAMGADPETLDLLAPVLESQLRMAGLADLTPFQQAMTAAKAPSRVEKRWAEKVLGNWEKLDEHEKARQQNATYTHQQTGKTYTLPELYQTARGVSGVTVAAPPKPVTPKVANFQRDEMLVDGKLTPVLVDVSQDAVNRVVGLDGSPIDPSRVKAAPPASVLYPKPEKPGPPATSVAAFNTIVNAYERSPLIRAGDRAVVLADAVTETRTNPTDPATQMKMAYAFIQALDTYQSAVREGELGALSRLGTQWESFRTSMDRVVNEGAFMPKEVALNIAKSSEQLIGTLARARAQKSKEYAARAEAAGVGDMWATFSKSLAPSPPTQDAQPPSAPERKWIDRGNGVRELVQ